jgi:hypothetical protein
MITGGPFWLHAEDWQDVPIDESGANALGLAVRGEVHGAVAEQADVRERRNVRLPLFVLVVREPGLIETGPRAPEDGDAFGMTIW